MAERLERVDALAKNGKMPPAVVANQDQTRVIDLTG